MSNIWNGTMFGDLDWPVNASRRFVSDSWVSYCTRARCRSGDSSSSFQLFKCYYAPPPRVGPPKRWCASDVCLSRTPDLSREQRGLGRLKLAQSQMSHVTRDSDTVKRSKVKLQGAGILWRPSVPHSLLLTIFRSGFVHVRRWCSWLVEAKVCSPGGPVSAIDEGSPIRCACSKDRCNGTPPMTSFGHVFTVVAALISVIVGYAL